MSAHSSVRICETAIQSGGGPAGPHPPFSIPSTWLRTSFHPSPSSQSQISPTRPTSVHPSAASFPPNRPTRTRTTSAPSKEAKIPASQPGRGMAAIIQPASAPSAATVNSSSASRSRMTSASPCATLPSATRSNASKNSARPGLVRDSGVSLRMIQRALTSSIMTAPPILLHGAGEPMLAFPDASAGRDELRADRAGRG